MPVITLAKALKLKNRLAGRLNKTQDDIRTYNSVLQEQANQVDIPSLLKSHDELQEILIVLKTNIIKANAEIQSDIIRLGELKSKLSFISTIGVVDGKQRHGYQNTEMVYVACLKKKDIDEETKKLETEVDKIQDKIDTFNHTTKFEVSQRSLDIAASA